MKTINLTKGITVTLADGVKHEIPAGIQTVEDDIAGHWYVKAHNEPLPEAVSPATGGRGRRKGGPEAEAVGDGQGISESSETPNKQQ